MSGITPETVLEIIELEDGHLAIRHANSDAEPMITVNFSETLRSRLDERYLEVARVMLTAGIQMVAESGFDLTEQDEPEEEPVLH